MVGTLKCTGIAPGLTAYQRTAMSTGIEQNANVAVVPADEDQRSPGNPPGAEVTRRGDFRFVAGINPTLTENPRAFAFEMFIFRKGPPAYPENACLRIIDNQIVYRRVLHIFSPEFVDRLPTSKDD